MATAKTPPKRKPASRTKRLSQDILDAIRMDPPDGASELPALGAETPEAQWLRTQGWTPIEFLTHVFKNPWLPIDLRVTSAKSLLEYAHRKLPTKTELTAELFGGLDLTRLSDTDLVALTKIIDKAKSE